MFVFGLGHGCALRSICLLASTAGEAVLIFVTVFDLAGGVAAIDFAVLVFVDVF
jgi:hypothetical protein